MWGIRIIEAGKHVGGALGSRRGLRRKRHRQQHDRLTLAQLHHFDRGRNRNPLETGGDAHQQRPDIADFRKLPGDAFQLPESHVAAVRAVLDEIVDGGIAEEARANAIGPQDLVQRRREHHQSLAPGEAGADTLVNCDIDERILSGHRGTCFSNCRHALQINRFLIPMRGSRVQRAPHSFGEQG